MIGLLIDVIVAWLLVRFVQPGTRRVFLGLLGGWAAALASAGLVGLAFGWTPFDMLSRLTVGLLVHPLIIAGLVWLFDLLRKRAQRPR